jgi:hypothetical protein
MVMLQSFPARQPMAEVMVVMSWLVSWLMVLMNWAEAW